VSPVVNLTSQFIHHRDTEGTEVAQRKQETRTRIREGCDGSGLKS
jgi:hypothetical protein